METMHAIGKDMNLKLNDFTICYDDFGSGDTPIIFIHGFPFDKSMWEDQIDFLKKTYRVIAYDIRGYGKSNVGEQKQSISLFADDLIKFMDALAINKAIICGFSMGGYTLLNALSRYTDRFAAIILSDTQCIADSEEVKEKRAKTIAEIKAGKVNDFAESFLSAVFCPASMELKSEQVEKARNIILSTSPLTIADGLLAISERSETCSALDKIDVPTLIVCGNEDSVTPAEQSRFLHKHIKNSQLHIIDNAGHMSNLEQTEQFNTYIGDFVGSL